MKSRVGAYEAPLVGSITGGFYAVYNYYGPGLLESVYCGALEDELRDRRHSVAREVHVPIQYKGRQVGWQRLDMIVDERIIVEVKATAEVNEWAERQILSYLNATPLEVGLLLHFGRNPEFQKYVQTLDQRRRGPFARRA